MLSSPFFVIASRSLRVRFLSALLLGAALVTAIGSYATYQAAQSHIENRLVERSRLLASAINHSAMIAHTDNDLQHVIGEVLNDNNDIRTIAVMLKDSQRVVASASVGQTAFSEHADYHLSREIVDAIGAGNFGFHVEDNLDLVLIAPLWHALKASGRHGGSGKQPSAPSDRDPPPEKHGAMGGTASSSAYHGSMAVQAGNVTGEKENHRTHQDAAPYRTHHAGNTSTLTGPGHGSTSGHNYAAANTKSDWITQDLSKSDYRGGILLRVDRSDVIATMSNILWGLMPVSVIGVLAILALAYMLLHFQVIAPIGGIRHVMKQQQSGDRHARAVRQSTLEFDEVAVAFNGMIDAISEREETIEKLALTDALTGLANRNKFNQSLQTVLRNAGENETRMALLFLDLDKFKHVNDTMGHTVGDRLLKEVADRISSCTRDSDVVARLGGDEFAIILSDHKSVECAEDICRRITGTISEPILVDGVEVCIGVSIGISYFPEQAQDDLALIRNADLALYGVKESNRGSYLVYDRQLQAAAAEALSIEHDLRLAIARKEFLLHYQPQIGIENSKLIGAEALIRWNHPQRGIIAPDTFIPVAENTGLILSVGEWVLRTACAQAKSWQDAGVPPFRVAVNISSRQLLDADFAWLVQNILEETGLDPIWLELEVTETMVMECSDHVSEILQPLSDLGISLAVDDFGTGHSSLSRLKSFPVDKLKIDRSFVTHFTPGSSDAAITTAIIQLARNLKMTVVAEGVETEEQLAYLAEQGCDQAQGYLFGKPMSDVAFMDWYTKSYAPEIEARNLRNVIGKSEEGKAQTYPDTPRLKQA